MKQTDPLTPPEIAVSAPTLAAGRWPCLIWRAICSTPTNPGDHPMFIAMNRFNEVPGFVEFRLA
jgi:hypothetical protein